MNNKKINEKHEKDVRLNNQMDNMIGKIIAEGLKTSALKDLKDTSACLTANEIAEFIDGISENREKVIKHLSECKTCYEIFADTVEALSLQDITVKPKSRFYLKPLFKVAIAALFLITFGITAYNYSLKPSVSSLTEMTSKINVVTTYSERANVYGFSQGVNHKRIMFQAGIYMTDLVVYLRQGDRGNAVGTLNLLTKNFESSVEFEAQSNYFINIMKKLNAGVSPKSLVTEVDKAKFEKKDYLYVRFGQWAEGGRLASSEKVDAYFVQKDIEYFKKILKEEDLPVDVMKSLEDIGKKTSTRPIEDYKQLLRLFEVIILLV
ncbi:MAG: hypothetical protein H7844_08775 [Nitrospirae bacterium YQR-1]